MGCNYLFRLTEKGYNKMSIKKGDKLVEIYNKFGDISRPTEETAFMIIELMDEYKLKTTILTLQEEFILQNQNILMLNNTYSDNLLSEKLGISTKLLQRKVKSLMIKLLINFLREGY